MWTPEMVATGLLCAATGLSLGLVGGGGSILTVPILVYVAGLAPKEAVALSLPIVGATAAVGAAIQHRQGNTHFRAALLFGVTGMLGAQLGAPWTHRVPGPALMLLLAAIMVVAGWRMAWSRNEAEPEGESGCRPLQCGLAGLGVGVLTGFLGVGGGFLIVPALLRFAHVPMRKAVGTSLLVIAANSASGFAAHLGEIGSNAPLAAVLTAAALAGLAGGTALGRRMRPAGLKAAFAGLALAVAAYLAAVNVGSLMDVLAHRRG